MENPEVLKLVQPRGKHYFEVFFCHGCQTCWELQEDDTLIQHEHILGQIDITDKIEKLLNE
jgi:MinD superfamily P-loop ATPase